MSKHRIFFYGSDSGSYKPRLETFINTTNEITIRIEDESNPDDFHVMSFDKSTAIKLAKTLRTEINKIDDGRG